MPSYLLTIFGDEQAYERLSPEEAERVYSGHASFVEALAKAGVSVEAAAELEPSERARTLLADGTVTDGPFAETKEQVGGFYLIDVPDMAAAARWAALIPVLPGDAVEVRKAR